MILYFVLIVIIVVINDYEIMFDIHENLPICHDLDGAKHRTSDVVLEEKVTFSSLLLKEEIQSGLTRCGYSYLSPIQKNALPVALTGTC